MSLYTYVSEGGQRIDVEKPMTEAPDIGHKIRRKGVTYVRQYSDFAPPKVRRDCFVKGISQPRNSPHHKGEFSKNGTPLYSSWGEVDGYVGRASENEHVETSYE